jgi:hypothetical protein
MEQVMADTPENNTNRTMPFSKEELAKAQLDELRNQSRLEAEGYTLRQQLLDSRREVDRLARANAALEASLRYVAAALKSLLDERPAVES